MAISHLQLSWQKILGTTPCIQSVSKSFQLSLQHTPRIQPLLIISGATMLVQGTTTSQLDHFSSCLTSLTAFTLAPWPILRKEAIPILLNPSHIMPVLCTKPSNGTPSLWEESQNLYIGLQGPTQSSPLLNLWSRLLAFSPPLLSVKATWFSLLFLEQARCTPYQDLCTPYPGPLHWSPLARFTLLHGSLPHLPQFFAQMPRSWWSLPWPTYLRFPLF